VAVDANLRDLFANRQKKGQRLCGLRNVQKGTRKRTRAPSGVRGTETG
jgi:hypothetical protein